jgi:bacillolysin
MAAGGALTPTLSPVTGLVTFLATHAGSSLPVAVSGRATPEDVTEAFLGAHGASFGIYNRADMQVTTIEATDAVGMHHVRLQQLHRGVRVTAGEMTVHLRGPAIIAVHAKTVADLTALDVIPTLPPEEAQAQVQAFLAKRFGISDAVLREPRLEILNPGLLEARQTSSYLTWFVQATAPALYRFFWVDAHTGALLLHFNQRPEALNRQIYNGGASIILPGTLARSEGDPPMGDADTDNAYTFLGDTYNYYLSRHGRDSVDDAGLTLVATVHSCADPNQPCPLPNAFWNGMQMVFGDGFASADDVTAHELTHAVTQYSANLFYYMQSGALNESFSDIFGESVDLTNGRGTDTAAVRWLIGEDLSGIGAIRNMLNPPQFGDPGKVSDTQFRCTSGDADHDGGGVHTNSGVPNHAYALMVDGGTYNGVTITGIGLAKAAQVQYRALTHYLVSGSNFLDNYSALLQSCADLIGTAGITSAACAEVKKALDAVEMFMTPCPQPPEPALCALGQTPTNVFFDNAENDGGNWQFGTLWSSCKGLRDKRCAELLWEEYHYASGLSAHAQQGYCHSRRRGAHAVQPFV